MNKYITLLGTSLIILLAFLAISTHKATACGNVTTGDANSYSCTENLVNTDSNYLPWFNNNCITPTPITPTPTIDPCANGACVTPAPTSAPSNSGGPGDGRSDNLGCGSHDCSNHPSSEPQVLGASTGPQVLGLSTTGGEQNYLLQFAQLFGALTSVGLGLAFFKKNG